MEQEREAVVYGVGITLLEKARGAWRRHVIGRFLSEIDQRLPPMKLTIQSRQLSSLVL